jgi:thioredoxin-like negative regulator of GroEL
VEGAARLFGEVLHSKDASAAEKAEAIAGLVATALMDGKLDNAEKLAEQLRKNFKDYLEMPYIHAVLNAVEMAKLAPGEGPAEAELRARLDTNKLDHEARLQLAARLAAANKLEEAIDQALLLVRYNKSYEDGSANRHNCPNPILNASNAEIRSSALGGLVSPYGILRHSAGAGQKLLLKVFGLLGDSHPLTQQGRKRLSNLMFV